MKKFKWLHLSDLHYSIKNFQSDWARDKLVEQIKKIKDIEIIFITGDLLYQFEGSFDDIKKFIEDIISAAGVDKKNVLIVPGNHDFERTKLRECIINGVLKSNESIAESILNIDTQTQDFLLKDMQLFFDFYEELLARKENWSDIHYLVELEKCDVVCLNTCLISGRSNEEGKLSINLGKLLNVLKSSNKSSKPKIAVGHHSIECFDSSEQEKIVQLFDDYGVDIYICGHMHKSKYKIYSESIGNIYSLVCGSGMVDDYAEASFIVGEVDVNLCKCIVKYYTWNSNLSTWKENDAISRRINSDDCIDFSLERLVKMRDEKISNDFEKIDEKIDEILKVNVIGSKFQKFLLDFCKNIQKYNEEVEGTKAVDVEEKFLKMKCSKDFQTEFDSNVEFFSVVNNIFKDPAYIPYDKKTLIPGVIRSVYKKAVSTCKDGDEIIDKMVDILCDQYIEMIGIPRLDLEQYFKTIIYWSIDKCTIYNDRK
ncbi:MAG: metallophosphoesterase [Clostridium sp.]|uniref:metallophosphoesterase family protein n=1 Tax=Clostridium sp. TaxID=1506 RepID=UPI002FCBDBD5